MNPASIGFITGLTAEAALLKNTPFMVGVGGGTPQGAAGAAQQLIGQGVLALISFGLAGGLNPHLAPGTIIIPRYINHAACDVGLTNWLGGATHERIYAGDAIAITAAEKLQAHHTHRADAVDLESGAVAEIAARLGVPFAALRAIADPATRTLPPAALIALNAAGQIKPMPILWSILQNPSQVPKLIALANDAIRARKSLVLKLKTLS
ncbi:MAG: hypothetical protein POG74_12650 [Acidocella sp.]|nr:hypothetical protein [Acidocella sp.]